MWNPSSTRGGVDDNGGRTGKGLLRTSTPATSNGNDICSKAASEPRRRPLRAAPISAGCPRTSSPATSGGYEICRQAASEPRRRQLRMATISAERQPPNIDAGNFEWPRHLQKAASEPRRRQLRTATISAERQPPNLDAGNFDWQRYLQKGILRTSTPATSSGNDICRKPPPNLEHLASSGNSSALSPTPSPSRTEVSEGSSGKASSLSRTPSPFVSGPFPLQGDLRQLASLGNYPPCHRCRRRRGRKSPKGPRGKRRPCRGRRRRPCPDPFLCKATWSNSHRPGIHPPCHRRRRRPGRKLTGRTSRFRTHQCVDNHGSGTNRFRYHVKPR